MERQHRIARIVGLFAVLLLAAGSAAIGAFSPGVVDADGAVLTNSYDPGCWRIDRYVVGLDDDGAGSVTVNAPGGRIEAAILTWIGSDDLTPQNVVGGTRADSTLQINGTNVNGIQVTGEAGYALFPENEWFVWEANLVSLLNPSSATTLNISGWDANWVTADPNLRDHTNGAIVSVIIDEAPCAEPVQIDVYQGMDYVHHGISTAPEDDYTEAIIFPMTNMPVEQIIEVPITFAGTEDGVNCRGLDLWGAVGTGPSPATYDTDFDIFKNLNNSARLVNNAQSNTNGCPPGFSGFPAPGLRAVNATNIGNAADISLTVAQVAVPPNQDWMALQMESVASNNGESGAWVLSAVVRRPRPDVLGDFVWHDVNRNCLQDPGEPGIAGITANLALDPQLSLAAPVPQITNAGGFYYFRDLRAGTHNVTFNLPAGYTFTEANCAADPADVADSDAVPTAGNPQQSQPIPGTIDGITGNISLDAGVLAPVDIELVKGVSPSQSGPFSERASVPAGQSAWFEVTVLSQARHPDGFPYQPVDAVSVSDTLPDGLRLVSTSASAGNFDAGSGVWTIGPMAPGESQRLLMEVIPEEDGSFTNSAEVAAHTFQGIPIPDVDSTPGNNAGEDDEDTATLDSGSAVLGDFVWRDLNLDGCQDPGEPGVSGIAVNLFRDGRAAGTTITDVDGKYLFTGLPAGDYEVRFGLPSYAEETPGSTCAAMPGRDSNGRTSQVSLRREQTDLSVDLGIQETQPALLAYTGVSFVDGLFYSLLVLIGGLLLAMGTTKRAWNRP